MKTLQELWDMFNMSYGNDDVKFMDRINGDGNTTIFHLTYNPISLVTVHRPVVISNTGTQASPVYQTLIEGSDYTINYELGQLIFNIPPRAAEHEREYNVTVEAYHCKINLNHFVQFYNMCAVRAQILYPMRIHRKISGIDVGSTDNSYISKVDLNLPIFNDFEEIEKIQQDEDSEKSIPCHRREDMLYFELDSNTDSSQFFYGPQDYTRWPVRATKEVRLPFWASWRRLYPSFPKSVDPNTLLVEETYMDDSSGSTQYAMYQIAFYMYEMREHWSERQNASTLRMSTLKDVQSAKMSVSQSLMRHISETAPGRGFIPNKHYQ